jgi:mannose-6-phosphate isomerase-like protein (cupin superfamily)
MKKINLREKLACFSDRWHPKILAELNGQHVKLVKLEGEFVWHHHEHEDELFLVLAGRLEMQFRDDVIFVEPGELIVVPRGVEHRPVAAVETHVLLLEPATTVNTGSAGGDRTVEAPEWI